MDTKKIEEYCILVNFLAKTLGPNYEVVLYDINDYSNSIVAIANNHISGRSIGAPLTNFSLSVISDEIYKKNDYKINYSSFSKDGKILRSSTMFIKDEKGELVGLLSINFDDSDYIDVVNRVMSLCHPDELLEHQKSYHSLYSILKEGGESLSSSIEEVIDIVIEQVLKDKKVPVNRLSQQERLYIVKILYKKGIFKFKSAISIVANKLQCSQPSVYRYLSKIHDK
ncbi:helix-turn-helix transcriptional regulator [Garciella nitratireducens]|uniref:helix-turn-helix transcriptional regulator n=1 Tax=Garciella nitratireducens TaxID=218205 RepID=UPI000DE9128B|nr:PAS domain-containing protein [Garciella nitratireducens]RBP36549.1 putative transcriptional regulator YheO [Garciella nitratireducens]